MNNCYANYGAVNARQMARLLEDILAGEAPGSSAAEVQG
ncbi:hypothetical protein BH23CHL8_BH23CHL8_03260 [soil metagenome]